jgi:hypothetical protein
VSFDVTSKNIFLLKPKFLIKKKKKNLLKSGEGGEITELDIG